MTGKLIVIEGTDGSGKATQTKRVIDFLNAKGYSCFKFGFPQYGSATGDIVGDCYLGKNNRRNGGSWFKEGASNVHPLLSSAFYAGDRFYHKNTILRAKTEGKIVVLDRYYQSNMAHQGGKLRTLTEREELWRKLELLEFEYFGIPKEDLTVFLHMPTSIAIALREKRTRETGAHADGNEADPNHLRMAEETYLQLAERFNWPTIKCAPSGNIDSLKSVEEITPEIVGHILPKL